MSCSNLRTLRMHMPFDYDIGRAIIDYIDRVPIVAVEDS